MTVKMLTEYQKETLVDWYLKKFMNINDLVKHYNCSTRTVKRVLEEKGCEPVWKRKAKTVIQSVNPTIVVNPGPWFTQQQPLHFEPPNLYQVIKEKVQKLFSKFS